MDGRDSKMKDGGEANKVECTLAPFEKYRHECRRVGNVVTVKRRKRLSQTPFFCLFVLPTHTHNTRGSQLGCVGQRDKTEHPILCHGKVGACAAKNKRRLINLASVLRNQR